MMKSAETDPYTNDCKSGLGVAHKTKLTRVHGPIQDHIGLNDMWQDHTIQNPLHWKIRSIVIFHKDQLLLYQRK